MTKMQVYVHDEADSRNFLHCYHRLTHGQRKRAGSEQKI